LELYGVVYSAFLFFPGADLAFTKGGGSGGSGKEAVNKGGAPDVVHTADDFAFTRGE